MRTAVRSIGWVSLFWLLAVPAAAAEDPAALFAQGQAEVEANCGECMGATRQGLEDGITKLRLALDLGYRNRAAAYRALADALGQLGGAFSTSGSSQQREVLEQQRDAYRRLLEITPNDTAVLYEYSATLADATERRSILERILKLDPKHPDALFALGEIDLERGVVDEGLRKMRAVFERAQGEQALAFGYRLLWALQARKRDAEVAQIQSRLEEVRAELHPRQEHPGRDLSLLEGIRPC